MYQEYLESSYTICMVYRAGKLDKKILLVDLETFCSQLGRNSAEIVRESGIGNRESGIGNRESGIGEQDLLNLSLIIMTILKKFALLNLALEELHNKNITDKLKRLN